MPMEESLTLEETNKQRIALGLKPLTDDKASVVDTAEDNYAKLREKEAKERETKYVYGFSNPSCFSWHIVLFYCLGRFRTELRSKSLTILDFLLFHGCIGFLRLRPPFMVLYKCLYVTI